LADGFGPGGGFVGYGFDFGSGDFDDGYVDSIEGGSAHDSGYAHLC
jgi:hypothetical protein